MENKSNTTGLRYQECHIFWGDQPTKKHPTPKDWLCMPISPKPKDEYAHLALKDKTKYVRILKREVRGKVRYFVQLIQEGYPPAKRNRNIADDEIKRVGTFEAIIESNLALVCRLTNLIGCDNAQEKAERQAYKGASGLLGDVPCFCAIRPLMF